MATNNMTFKCTRTNATANAAANAAKPAERKDLQNPSLKPGQLHLKTNIPNSTKETKMYEVNGGGYIRKRNKRTKRTKRNKRNKRNKKTNKRR